MCRKIHELVNWFYPVLLIGGDSFGAWFLTNHSGMHVAQGQGVQILISTN